MAPPLKWAGGKRWLAPTLRPIWDRQKERRLVEPFCGGLAVTLELVPGKALLNDINPHAVNFYRWLKKGLIMAIPLANSADTYYAHRETFNQLIREGDFESQVAAELFYYLNKTGYNGLCRFNASGFYNVPFGRYSTINYACDFLDYRDHLKRWDFTCGDFSEIDLQPADFIYADPPYDVQFTTYSKESFTWNDQVRLVERLAKHPGPVILSNQATDRVVDLYRDHGYRLEFRSAPRKISCTGDRSPAREVLAFKGL